jgi:outer membrane protein assembly factor BamE (lipoprotein component of BamABCDE complex)
MKYFFAIALVAALAGCSTNDNNRSSFASLSTAETAARDIVVQTRFTQAIVVQRTNFYGTTSYTPGARYYTPGAR